MIDLRGECDLGRLEGVVCGEVDGEEEDSALVRAVRRPHDGGLPVVMLSNVSYCYLTSDQCTCQWNMSSPTGPAEHCAGGSRPRSCSSLLMRFRAMPSLVSSVLEDYL